MSIIENGYRLPFISLPLAVKLRNNKSARIHADFVDQAVLELLNSDRVRMVNERPVVVNPLSLSVQPCGKKRSILDLRHVTCKTRDNGQLEKSRISCRCRDKVTADRHKRFACDIGQLARIWI